MDVRSPADSSVAVVIPCFDHSHVLGAALESVLSQDSPADEIVVVDDGSTDDPAAVVSDFPGVSLIRQEHRGPSAARNVGLRAVSADKVIFLDADDRLLPRAVSAGRACFLERPDAAFVYGGYEQMLGRSVEERFKRCTTHEDLVRCNWIAMIATVMFDRSKLIDVGGFDEALSMCEDWDAYLRLARIHPYAAHDELVAVYVRHASNRSNDQHELRRWIAAVRERELQRGLSKQAFEAWKEGASVWDSIYPVEKRRGLFELLEKTAAWPALRRRNRD